MTTLTPEGRHLVQDLARRHDFSEEAVTRLLETMTAGQGRMAQFSHPELGGSGQWMSGGMLMIGNLFDQALKARVGNLCGDLSDAIASSAASLSSSTSSFSSTTSASSAWWPPELGTPSAAGSQDSMRYAYFAGASRLAMDIGGEIRVHDTLDHRIGGFSQQQGTRDGISMSSQHGRVDLATLPIVSDGGRTSEASSDMSSEGSLSTGVDAGAARATTREDDPLQVIERLGELHARGLLSDDEFATKKHELLSRL